MYKLKSRMHQNVKHLSKKIIGIPTLKNPIISSVSQMAFSLIFHPY